MFKMLTVLTVLTIFKLFLLENYSLNTIINIF
jgi:hypothetical protein